MEEIYAPRFLLVNLRKYEAETIGVANMQLAPIMAIGIAVGIKASTKGEEVPGRQAKCEVTHMPLSRDGGMIHLRHFYERHHIMPIGIAQESANTVGLMRVTSNRGEL